jgi:hypothetical protein
VDAGDKFGAVVFEGEVLVVKKAEVFGGFDDFKWVVVDEEFGRVSEFGGATAKDDTFAFGWFEGDAPGVGPFGDFGEQYVEGGFGGFDGFGRVGYTFANVYVINVGGGVFINEVDEGVHNEYEEERGEYGALGGCTVEGVLGKGCVVDFDAGGAVGEEGSENE